MGRCDGLKNGSARKRLQAFWALIKHDLRASRTALLVTLIVVLLVSTLALRVAGQQSSSEDASKQPDLSVSASIIDEDQSILGGLLVNYLEGIRYVTAIYDDTLPRAMERLQADEIIVAFRLPPHLLEEPSTGSLRDPIELWLNPRMPAESHQLGILVRQYAAALNYVYGSVFGYQRLYVELGGDENTSWEKATGHSLNTVMMYIDRDRFVKTGDLLSFNLILYALSGVLIVLSLLPAMGVLAGTIRLAGTSYEDRLLVSCGPTSLMAVRLLMGFVWWVLLIGPLLITLRITGVLQSIFAIAFALLSVYLMMALIMLAVGRARAPGVSVLQTGWLVFFLFMVMGGVLYPTSLFPNWLDQGAKFTPLYPAMQTIYRAFLNRGVVPARDVLVTCWPLLPAFIAALLFGRRRV
ncbi:MAG: ABC transporter permease [Clostridiaceae bacterium]|nr:ABC transporter permease [Clostridiaceae bacterium]